jgi:hypothetical protein
MKGFVYVVARDFGFAPNPFGGYCTLATCKPKIRKSALVGDIIIGLSSRKSGNKLIYAMRVSEKITFNDYWYDIRFQFKKPVMNGSLVKTFGDNIYHFDEKSKNWCQLDSHHSLEGGQVNTINLNNDTKTDAVLISIDFYYFGINSIEIPKDLKKGIRVGRSHRNLREEKVESIWKWLESENTKGINGDPTQFHKGFIRYDGK